MINWSFLDDATTISPPPPNAPTSKAEETSKLSIIDRRTMGMIANGINFLTFPILSMYYLDAET